MAIILSSLQSIGSVYLFGQDSVRTLLRHGVPWREAIESIYAVGVRSLLTTVVTGLFVGAILAIQLDLQLKDFGAQGFLGGLSTSVTLRNIGPVLIGFILCGKVGAYTSAELGTMRVTDQVDALVCLGADPIRALVVPRLFGAVIGSFLLLVVGLMAAIAGGAWVASTQLGINPTAYARNIPLIVSGWSLWVGIFKSFIFGAVIGVVCCYHGFHTTGGAAGVGRSVRRTAVHSLVTIIVADVALSSFFGAFAEWWGRG